MDLSDESNRPTSDGRDDGSQWARLESEPRSRAWAQTWLELQCARIDGCRRGALLIGPPDDGPFSLAAVFPVGSAPAPYLIATAETALSAREPSIQLADAAGAGATSLRGPVVAQPVLLAGRLHGVVVLEVGPRADRALEDLQDELRWGLGWLAGMSREPSARTDVDSTEGLEFVLGLLATVLEHDRFQGAVTAFATELAGALSCERTSVGFVDQEKVKILGMSHSARFSGQANLVHAVEAAMDESLDQESTIVFPIPEEYPRFCHAHVELSRRFEAQAVLTVPLVRPSGAVGAITLERDVPFDPPAIALVEAAAALAGAALDTLRLEDRGIGSKLVDWGRSVAEDLIGPQHVALKLVAGLTTVTLLSMLVITGTYRVSADTVLEPAIRRAAVAAADGFIARAPVRAGDRVTEGQLLVGLDDRDFLLERTRWESELTQAVKQHRVALAKREAAQVEILAASVDEARAELARINELLSRIEFRAPFDGLVVAGDLSQRLGAPAKRGEVLLEVAPLDSYRLYMKVDEREIDEVATGQRGSLVLSSLPTTSFDFVVGSVTPVAAAEEGRNAFRVEGRLEDPEARLSPGMQGVAKIEVGERRLAWIWFHSAVDWLRLKLWAWTP